MRSYVTIYVPKQYRNVVIEAQREFAIIADGSTTTNATGRWIDSDGTLVSDDIALVKAFCEDYQYIALRAKALDIAKLLIDAGEQSIAIEINGEFSLIERELTLSEIVANNI